MKFILNFPNSEHEVTLSANGWDTLTTIKSSDLESANTEKELVQDMLHSLNTSKRKKYAASCLTT